MTSTDMTPAIQPKSDQLNADSLRGGPLTITISGVSISPGTEQPVTIAYAGGEAAPWKPCKSMGRVLVEAWGADASRYVGKSLTLYRDPKVKWGGMEVGGIRISHMTDIDRDMVMVLTATKGKSAPFSVKRMEAPSTKPTKPDPDQNDPIHSWADDSEQFARTNKVEVVTKWWDDRASDDRFKELHSRHPRRYAALKAIVDGRALEFAK